MDLPRADVFNMLFNQYLYISIYLTSICAIYILYTSLHCLHGPGETEIPTEAVAPVDHQALCQRCQRNPRGGKNGTTHQIYIYICYIIYLFIYYISYIWCCPTRMELIPNGITGCVRCRFLTKHIQNISISANGPNSLVMVSVLSGSYTGRIVGHF